MIGRTITAVVDRDHSGALLLLDDGTAVSVRGEGYETSAVQLDLIDAQERRALARAAQGHREAARLSRLRQQEWRSITCQERTARKRAADAKMDRMGMLMKREWQDAMMQVFMDSNRMLYGQGPRTVRDRCESCGERFCENAPTRVVPTDPGYNPDFSWSTVTIPVKAQRTV